jgi:hypothetical protein
MSTDNIDPSKKDAKISSADDLVKTSKKGEVELSENELEKATGGAGTVVAGWDIKPNKRV